MEFFGDDSDSDTEISLEETVVNNLFRNLVLETSPVLKKTFQTPYLPSPPQNRQDGSSNYDDKNENEKSIFLRKKVAILVSNMVPESLYMGNELYKKLILTNSKNATIYPPVIVAIEDFHIVNHGALNEKEHSGEGGKEKEKESQNQDGKEIEKGEEEVDQFSELLSIVNYFDIVVSTIILPSEKCRNTNANRQTQSQSQDNSNIKLRQVYKAVKALVSDDLNKRILMRSGLFISPMVMDVIRRNKVYEKEKKEGETEEASKPVDLKGQEEEEDGKTTEELYIYQQVKQEFPYHRWLTDDQNNQMQMRWEEVNQGETFIVSIKKRAIGCNFSQDLKLLVELEKAYPHLSSEEKREQRENVDTSILNEIRAIEKCSVPLTWIEVMSGIISNKHHDLAISILHQHGVVILPDLYDRKMILEWGEVCKADMRDCITTLAKEKNVDLLKNHSNGNNSNNSGNSYNSSSSSNRKNNIFLDNYHELSMREAYRCDLRNGKRMKLKYKKEQQQQNQQHSSISSASYFANKTPDIYKHSTSEQQVMKILSTSQIQRNSAVDDLETIQTIQQEHTLNRYNLRNHLSIVRLLQDVMNPISKYGTKRDPDPASSHDYKGNWGRWNFLDTGPESGPPKLTCGNVGCVMSFPNCVDQTIHADTPHLFVHCQLPGHYYNQFTLALHDELATDFQIGQTAFVVGSHQLNICAKLMSREEEEQQDQKEEATNQDKMKEEKDLEHAAIDEEMSKRLIRPHVKVGDAILFDCRLLHYGLANDRINTSDMTNKSNKTSTNNKNDKNNKNRKNNTNHEEEEKVVVKEEEGRKEAASSSSSSSLSIDLLKTKVENNPEQMRPLLYINYHQSFFTDPKNWNDREKLFPEN